MIKLKSEGFIQDSETTHYNRDKLTIEEVVAHTFVFFIAGFETTSSTMALCLYELAKNQELQRKAQREIDEVLKSRNSDDISYEHLPELKYLEKCIDETLRKYPPAPFLIRECTKKYKVSGTCLTIPKKTPIIISTFGLHRDPYIYEDPLNFNPERFSDSSTGQGNAKGLFYLPFGDGPRICIGMRMGKLTSRIGLLLLLSKFNFNFIGSPPQGELSFTPKQFVLTLKDDINLRVSLREPLK